MTRLAESMTLLIADMTQEERESITLLALRDTLLRKLISAELLVENAEWFTAAVRT